MTKPKANLKELIGKALSPLTGLLLGLQVALVVTGGAVRLTKSGLGCPTWPKCTPESMAPVANQAEGALRSWIEFGNRLFTFVLLAAAIATVLSIYFSHRRDLRKFGFTQILGIFGQGVLGGITVLTHLNPAAVAGHFLLSIALIASATVLHSRRGEPAVIKTSPHSARSAIQIALTLVVLALGTIVTGAGPHAGDEKAPRFNIRIEDAALFHSVAVIVLIAFTVFMYFTKDLARITKKRIRIFLAIALAQGALGYIQYLLRVPELLVAAHLFGSTLVWIAALRIRLSVVTQSK